MIADLPKRSPPAWILFPTFLSGTCAVAAGWLLDSLPAGLSTALIASVLTAWWAEHRLRAAAEPISHIAAGDRYAVLPEHTGGGIMANLAAAAERMRQSLIDADALVV